MIKTPVSPRRPRAGKLWLHAFALAIFAIAGAQPALANHPVLVEGNCDSPVPGTTIVSPAGTCGDFDGDGRIGTAEDTDGADRIFGTLQAALGPGTGAAAGTGANQNGRIVIVTSGRFSEPVIPGFNTMLNIQTSAHVQIEAAPGVEAAIDAVFQGDPAGQNNVRQEAIGVIASGTAGSSIVLRNLTIRNFAIGMRVGGAVRVYVENCRFDNNRDFGVQALNETRVRFNHSRVTGTGRRVGTANNTTAFGHGVQVADLASVTLANSAVINSLGAGVQNTSARASGRFHLYLADNDGGDNIGAALVALNF